MPDDVILAKVEIIERCLHRIREEYAGVPANLYDNWTRQDSILLNLERACQASIDLALRLVSMIALRWDAPVALMTALAYGIASELLR